MSSLRLRLRVATSIQHERLDRVFSAFDPACVVGLARLLRSQGAATGAIRCLPAADAAEALALRDEMLDAIGHDLRALGAPPPRTLAPAAFHPVSVRYVLLGSRMGMRVLRRRWAASEQPEVRVADRTLSLPPGSAWRRFCEETGQSPERGDLSDQIVADARHLFDLFAAAAEHAESEALVHPNELTRSPTDQSAERGAGMQPRAAAARASVSSAA